ncbi:type III secretion system protein [Escherichia coli]|uniref:Type III secretion system protein n=1 Tax=Escherichia coli TaxID=562 RepID=A0A485JAG5_ECOLX|nr:type III secretion system protein [Escherichia coli]
MAEDDAVDTYVEWIGSYGYQNRMLVTKFIKETLFSDINALDASCSSLEFGMFLNKFVTTIVSSVGRGFISENFNE